MIDLQPALPGFQEHRLTSDRLTVQVIKQAVSDHYRIPEKELDSHRRDKLAVRPRQVAMYLARHLTPHSYPRIGQFFGDRDHTTVIHACRRVEELKSTDPDLAEAVAQIARRIA